MKPPADIAPSSSGEAVGREPAARTSPPANWREALMALVAARVALIELESKDVAKGAAKLVFLLLAACVCVVFGWALLLGGGVALVSKTSGWPWDRVAIGAAVVHLVGGCVLALLAKPSAAVSFPVTRAEFTKDREWIENFQNTKKSND